MPYRPTNRPIRALVIEIDSQLKRIDADFTGRDLRDKVRHLAELQRRFSDLGVSVVHAGGITARSARERIRAYLQMYVGISIECEELQIVSGIGDYGRRIRELRVEEGYQIASGASPDPESGLSLRPEQYILVTKEPDADAARRWHVANRIRRTAASSQDRVLEFLKENVGVVVTTEELAYVAKNAREFARRTRELRTEDGYPIATRFTGRPDLRMGQYVLESLDRVAEPHDRKVSDAVQRAVYERDNNTCLCCGWTRARWTRADPRILELHHVDEHAGGGPNTAENLIVLCSKCHDDVHAGRTVVSLVDGLPVFKQHAAGE